MIAVINDERDSLNVRVSENHLSMQCDNITIYVEDIKPLKRKATRVEMENFFEILKYSGFSHFLGNSVVLGKNHLGKEGIFIVDTRFTNFLAPFDSPGLEEKISALIHPHDEDWAIDKHEHYFFENSQLVARYCELCEIDEASLNMRHLYKTYIPEGDRRIGNVNFVYKLTS